MDTIYTVAVAIRLETLVGWCGLFNTYLLPCHGI